MAKERTQIMSATQIQQKLTRMAHEIYENYYQEKELTLIGIEGRGKEVAKRLSEILSSISAISVKLEFIELNKDKPLSGAISYTGETKNLKGKAIILVDDVLNSGRTLIYAAKHLLDAEPKSMTTAVLVDRFHRRFPIRADYVGLTLSTNLKEHIEVVMGGEDEAVYLQ
jgi:pyrimidine operon attenuation protein/uracil phosphoribosyltransferase